MGLTSTIKHAVITLLVISSLLLGCKSENKPIDQLDMSFEHAWIFVNIMNSGQYMAVDSLGAGTCTLTLDSMFLEIPTEDIELGFYKLNTEVMEDGTSVINMKQNDVDVVMYMQQEGSDEFECELYVQDRMIRFEPRLKVVKSE